MRNVFHIPDTPTLMGLVYIPSDFEREKRSAHVSSNYGRVLVDDLWSTGPYFEVLGGTAKPITEVAFCERFWTLQEHPAIKRFVPLESGIAVLAKVLYVDGRCTVLETYYGDKINKLNVNLNPGDVVYTCNDESHYWLPVAEAIKRF